jgi:TolB-like protein/Tfp pilus assembly protein PilF
MPIWSIEIKEFERLYESLKGRYPELEKETEQLIRTEDANVVMLYSRRCLEVIITDLCECELKRPRKTEPLKGIIDKLSHEEKIPSHIVASMQSLNSLSTFGTHPKEFDPEQVRPVLNNLTTIIKWYLKYKDSQAISKPLTEEAKDEMKGKDEPSKQIQKSKKRLIILLSGLTLVIVIVVVALFVFNIIGERERAEDLTKLEKSIAVLPFENLSNDEEQAWFSDGITDVIISQLSKISDLRVLGRTSTLKYKEIEEKKSISEIGDELGVNFIIEGTVQRQENKMRISVQLIRTLNEGHIWSDIYDREWKDIFDIQSDIAQRIAGELKTALTPEVKEQIEKSQTKNPEAYNLYLQGRFFWSKRTEEGLKKSVEYFEKALAADPDYALAYAGLADAYFIQAWWGWVPWVEGNAQAKEFALRALDIDKNLAEAHTVLGALLHWNEWDFEEARKELLLAIELNPNYTIARQYYSELLDILRQNDEARLQINYALKLDPFYPMLHSLSSMYYYNEGKLKESLDEYLVMVELAPHLAIDNWRPFYIYMKQGEDIKAVEEFQKIILLDTLTAKYADNVKEVYNKSGINGLLNFLIDLQPESSIPSHYILAQLYALLGKKEEALDCLEKTLEEYEPHTLRINSNPDFDYLRSEPRFVALIKKMGLSDYGPGD